MREMMAFDACWRWFVRRCAKVITSPFKWSRQWSIASVRVEFETDGSNARLFAKKGTVVMKIYFKCFGIKLGLLVALNSLAQDTTFTYQGRLSSATSPANGVYDLRFTICDSTNNPGSILSGPVTNVAVAISNGLFTLPLDFGSIVFNGEQRWLEIAVRTNGAGAAFSTLTPRQLIAPTPLAIHARNAASAATVVSVPLSALPSSVLRTETNSVVNLAGDLYVTSPPPFFAESFEGATFPPGAAWSTFPGGGSAPWFRTTSTASQGTAAAASGTVPNFGDTFLQLTCTMPVAGVMKFDWKVESYLSHHVLRIEVDAVPQTNISGFVDWTTVTLPLSAGGHTIRWVYAKDGIGVPIGEDRGWVDNVRLMTASGAMYAASFIGDGNGLTGLNASSLISGTVADGRLSANVALRSGGNAFSGGQLFNGQIRLDHTDGFSQSSVGNFYIDAPFIVGGRVTVLPNGMFGIGTASPTNKLHVIGGATFTSPSAGANQTVVWTPGSGSWSFTSDRNTKERVESVSLRDVLDKLCSVPVAEWNYKGYAQRHIGPMAQDFHAAFPLNDNDTSLNDADLHGVALAAIQGLNQKLEERTKTLEADLKRRDRENAELKSELAELKKLVQQISQQRAEEGRN